MKRLLLTLGCAAALPALAGYDDLKDISSEFRNDSAFWQLGSHPQVAVTTVSSAATTVDARAWSEQTAQEGDCDFLRAFRYTFNYTWSLMLDSGLMLILR